MPWICSHSMLLRHPAKVQPRPCGSSCGSSLECWSRVLLLGKYLHSCVHLERKAPMLYHVFVCCGPYSCTPASCRTGRRGRLACSLITYSGPPELGMLDMCPCVCGADAMQTTIMQASLTLRPLMWHTYTQYQRQTLSLCVNLSHGRSTHTKHCRCVVGRGGGWQYHTQISCQCVETLKWHLGSH